MKKIAIVMFVVAAALAGCGKKKPAAAPAPTEGSAAPAEGSAAPAEGSAAAPAGDAPPAGG